VLLLSLFFSETAGRPATKLVLLVGLALVVVVALAMSRLSMSMLWVPETHPRHATWAYSTLV